MMTTLNKVSIITVNYKSTLLINSLEAKLADFDIEYVVVDNSGDFSPSESSTKVVRSGGNLGFGQGCNLGVEESTGDVVMFLNPDAEIDRANLSRLLEFNARQDQRSVWGPCIRDHAREVVILERPGRAGLCFRRRPLSPEELGLKTIDVAYVSGACMVMHRTTFDLLGGFSREIFLYGEDLDLCIRAKAEGIRVFITTAVEVSHKGGDSSTKLDRLKRLLRSTKGHHTFLRSHGYGSLTSAINALHLASGRRF